MRGVPLHTKANDHVTVLENVVQDNLSWGRLLNYLFWLSSFYYYFCCVQVNHGKSPRFQPSSVERKAKDDPSRAMIPALNIGVVTL